MRFERGSSCGLTSGVEQATAEAVAKHKPARFRSGLVVDLCAGIGSDTLALARAVECRFAVDLDQGMCRRVLYNAEVHGLSDRILAVRAGPSNSSSPRAHGFIWTQTGGHRASGRAAATGLCPGPEFWSSVIERVAAGAIKLGPAADFSRHFAGSNVEIELISLHGECKEATVWFGELVSCRRRATRLPENVTWTDRDTPSTHFAAVAARLSRLRPGPVAAPRQSA